ncbi:hypothetical protein AVEN_60081-1 [Araneus ventricosus]|uniref:Uncharacterized protein n=1 Tax=Araneus ventricosus TaxID=182803 RepID=A0A4Y2HYH8_ARAVE|nr:hypothetical protein AVEN_60081-1 [Araneus ventricosus]
MQSTPAPAAFMVRQCNARTRIDREYLIPLGCQYDFTLNKPWGFVRSLGLSLNVLKISCEGTVTQRALNAVIFRVTVFCVYSQDVTDNSAHRLVFKD